MRCSALILLGLSAACRQAIPNDDKDPIVDPPDTDVDDTPSPDPDDIPVPVVGQVVGLVSGTGSLTSPNYQATVVIGGPAVTTPTASSPGWSVQLGVGAAQAVEAP